MSAPFSDLRGAGGIESTPLLSATGDSAGVRDGQSGRVELIFSP